MNQAIQDFIQSKRIAIVGVSRTGKDKKFGNIACKELKQRGYQVYIVHPEAQEIDGERCYPNLAALQGKVDGVVISVPPTHAAQVLREAANAGIKQIWLQQGAQSFETQAAARELGVTPVTCKCILMYAQPVRGFHTIHRGFVKLMGQL
jgi:predicted CoA-binding protein